MGDWAQGNGHRDPLPPPRTGRRRSLITLAALLIALPTAYFLSLIGGDWRQVAAFSDLEEAGVIYLPNLRVFLVHTDQGPLALSARSPHLGERVLYCRFADAFQEAHGSLFDRRGFSLAGPADRGLDRVAVRVRAGIVEIEPSELLRGPPRVGATEDVSGTLCLVPGPEDPPGFAAARLVPGS